MSRKAECTGCKRTVTIWKAGLCKKCLDALPEGAALPETWPGRHEHKPSRESRGKVLGLVINGEVQETIAGVLGIDDKTLRNHYREELDYGMAKLKGEAANTLVKRWKGGCVTSLIFFLKARCGYSERNVIEGPDGGPLTIRVEYADPNPKPSSPA